MSSYFTKLHRSAYSFFDSFTDVNSFNLNWTPRPINTAIISVTNGVFTGSSIYEFTYAYTGNQFDNFRVIACSKAQSGASSCELGLLLHSNSAFNNYYNFSYYANKISLSRIDNNGMSYLTGVSYIIAENTYYWWMAEQFNGTLKCFYSTDGFTYTMGACWNVGSYDAYSQYEHGGFVGTKGYANSTVAGKPTIKIDSFEVQELGTIFDKEDIIKSAYAMSGVYGVTVMAEISGITQLSSASTGSCYIYGTSNNVFSNCVNSGDSWNTLTTSGGTFSDFIAELEVRGTSGMNIVFLVAASNLGGTVNMSGTYANWYGNWIKANSLGNNNNDIVQFNGLSKYYYLDRGEFWNFQANNWYKYKLVKIGSNLIWEINDQIINSMNGVSLIGGGTQVYIGVATYNANGASVEFRNFRISELDDFVDNVAYDPGTQVQSLIDRVLPNGFAVINNGSNVELFQIGDANGTLYIGLSD